MRDNRLKANRRNAERFEREGGGPGCWTWLLLIVVVFIAVGY